MSNLTNRLRPVKATSAAACPVCGCGRVPGTGPDGRPELACPECDPGPHALAVAERAANTSAGQMVRLMHATILLAAQMADEHTADHPRACRCHFCRHASAVVGAGRSRAEMTRALGLLETAAGIVGDMIEGHELEFTEPTYEGELRNLAAFCDGIGD